MPTTFFFDSIFAIAKFNTWQPYFDMRKKVDELISEEKWWHSVSLSQLKADMEREESEKKATELFNWETYQLRFNRHIRVLNMKRRIKNLKRNYTKSCLSKVADEPKIKHSKFKSEYQLLMELKAIDEKEELSKWLFKTLCFITSPGRNKNSDWNQCNDYFREVIESKGDLEKLKKLSRKHRPEWWCFFNC